LVEPVIVGGPRLEPTIRTTSGAQLRFETNVSRVSLPVLFEEMQVMLVLGSDIRIYSSSGWVLLVP
jgi:hypothetical protein